MDDLDILLELYKQRANLVEEVKKQLASVSSILITIAALLFGIITHDNAFSLDNLPLAFILVFIGILGILFTYKNKERYFYHTSRYLTYLRAIDAILRWKELQDKKINEMRNEVRNAFELDEENSLYLIESIVDRSSKDHMDNDLFLAQSNEHIFWIALHFLISVIGVIVVITIILKNILN